MKLEQERKRLLEIHRNSKIPIIRSAANVFKNMQANLTLGQNNKSSVIVSNLNTKLTRLHRG